MKKLLLSVALLAGMAGGSLARTVEQQVVARLQQQGYVVLEQGYTFLGRLRIIAENGEFHREIVVNPGTGEILRDHAVSLPHAASPVQTHPVPSVAPPAPVDAVPPAPLDTAPMDAAPVAIPPADLAPDYDSTGASTGASQPDLTLDPPGEAVVIDPPPDILPPEPVLP